MNEYFYGWYFRCQGSGGSLAVIPAVHVSEEKQSCSIQIITQKGSLCREFPISQFRIDRKKCRMQIGENRFSRKGIRLDLEAPGGVTVKGAMRFGAFSEPKYDMMGPFSLIPRMECSHAVYSMKHTVNGMMEIGGEKLEFHEGEGYMEGDSGVSFPDRYIWTQHFLPEGSMMIAAASIPLAGVRFTGTVGFLFLNGREYRFATYLGASVEKMKDGELLIRQGRYRLQVRLPEFGGSMLNAPESGKMTRKIREDIACRAEYTLTCGGRVLLHAVTDRAAAEYDVKEGFFQQSKQNS